MSGASPQKSRIKETKRCTMRFRIFTSTEFPSRQRAGALPFVTGTSRFACARAKTKKEFAMSNTVVNLPKRNNWTKGGPVVSQLNEEEITLLEARATATVADPTVLGLWGFATGTWIVGTVIADIFPASAFTATIPVLLVFAGLTQFIAGLFAFRRTNVLAATAFCSFGAFNVLTALLFAMQAHGTLAQTGDPMVIQGFVLESFAFIALALMLAAMRTNMGLVTVLGTLGIGYALSGIPDLANAMTAPGWSIIKDIGGWFLVASAFFAFYTGMALVVNSTWNRTVLPIGGEP